MTPILQGSAATPLDLAHSNSHLAGVKGFEPFQHIAPVLEAGSTLQRRRTPAGVFGGPGWTRTNI